MTTQAYKEALASTLKNENIFLYWKGRVALFALLKAMGVSAGDEVILPGFTCVVVPNAIKYLGLPLFMLMY
ncbi:MAG: DegT/DnrJ/EryC1/StrS family aminotransferase [Bacteroidales bacterium]